MTTSPKPRGPLFWILVIGGVVTVGCCMTTALIATLGVLASEPDSAASNTGGTRSNSAGSEFLIAVEIARGSSLTTSLPGARWMDQFGSAVNHVVGRVGDFQWVQTNTSGSLYELIFDDDGGYIWNWASNMTMNGLKSESHCAEKGEWELSGTQLTLKPSSQKCVYSSGGVGQEEEDKDLNQRSYQAVDLTLETLNDPKQQVPAVLMIGPRARWDTGYGEVVTLKLQRLAE